MSERGGGAGVTISGAHTVTAQGGAELLHACQSLCREGVRQGQTPQDQAAEVDDWVGGEGGVREFKKVRDKRKGRYTGIKC